MAAKKCGAPPRSDGSSNRPDCVAAVRAQSRDRNQHYADAAARRARILNITAWLAVMVSASFVLVQIVTDSWTWQVSSVNVAGAMVFLLVPWLQRFGELVAPLTFLGAAYVSVFASCLDVGTGAGGQFFFLVGACLVVTIFLPVYLVQVRRYTPEAMSNTVALLGITAPIGGVLVPGLSDRFGRRPLMVVFTGLMALTPLAALLFHGPEAILVALLFIGWLGIGSFPLFMAVVPAETLNFRIQ